MKKPSDLNLHCLQRQDQVKNVPHLRVFKIKFLSTGRILGVFIRNITEFKLFGIKGCKFIKEPILMYNGLMWYVQYLF